SLTLNGATGNTGTLVLTGTNSFTGVTTLGVSGTGGGGALSVASIGDGGVAGNLGAAASAATNLVFYGRQTATAKLIYTGATASTNRGFTIGGDAYAVFDISNPASVLTISGAATSGSSTAFLIKRGAGTLVLSGLSSRGSSGYDQVLAGTLQFSQSQAIYTSSSANWTAAHLAVASGATLAFNVGGTGELTSGYVTTLLSNLAASTSATNGMNAGSFLGFDTSNSAGGTFTIADSIANTTGTSGGTRGLTKLGANSLVLATANTYTGPTTINGGTLALGSSGSLAAATTVTIAAGASFDVSALTGSSATYNWNTAALKASGTGTAVGTAATLSGAAGGTLNMGATPINLTWAGNSTGMDAGHPSLTVSGATLALAGNQFTVVTSTALASGTYTLVSAAAISGGSTVSATPLYTGGSGVVSGLIGTVSISGNSVILTVSSGVAGALDHFAISTISSPKTAGTAISGITLTAQDYTNATVTSFTGTVTFGGSAGVTGTSAAFSAGVLNSVSITPVVAGNGLTFTVTATGRVGSSTFNVIPGPVTAGNSTVTAAPASVTADGSTPSIITVTLKDSNGNAVSGKAVTLVSSRNSTDTISAASGASSSTGVVTFTVKSATTGSAVFTATDSTDSVVISQTAGVSFTATPTVSAANSTVSASPSAVPADGSTTTTITVTLKDTSNNPVAGKSVALTSSRGAMDTISPATGIANASGVVTFTAKSTSTGAAVFTATDTTNSIVLAQTAVVTLNAVAAQAVTQLNISASGNGAEILNVGTLVAANHFGGVSDGMSAPAAVTLDNGLTFGTSTAHLTYNWAPVHSTAAWSGASAITNVPYKTLLSNVFWLAGTQTPQLNIPGLIQGHTYRLQLISDDPQNAAVTVEGNPLSWTGSTPSVLTVVWFQEYSADTVANIIISRTAGEIKFNGYALHDLSTANSLKNITSFTFPGLGDATLSGSNISISVPSGTSVTSLSPTYTLTTGATCTPTSGAARNFSSPQVYTVTALDGTTKDYIVTVSVAPVSTAKDILACSFGTLGTADINGTNVMITVPIGTALTSLAPTFTLSPLATISPASGSSQNFTNPVNYTVTAQDGSSKVYSVTVRTFAAWQYSASLFILTTPEGANLAAGATEANFPVLVRLNSKNFTFSQAQSDGRDLRFTTSAGSSLSYQIEQWDAIAGTASVWVKIPSISGNARQEIKMYWGKPDALSESNAANVFNATNGFVSVFHLAETVQDELGSVTPVNAGSTVADGLIGKGRHFDAGSGINCGDHIYNYPYASNPFTSECWFRTEIIGGSPLYYGRYATRYNGNTGDGNEVNIAISAPASLGWSSDGPGGATAATVPSVGQWYHVAATYSGGVSKIYVNGVLDGSRTGGATAMSVFTDIQMKIGGWRGSYNFAGDIDEARVSSVARSANWMKLQYENQKSLQTLVGLPVQTGSTFAVNPTSVTMNEGTTIPLIAEAGGAQKLYWVRRQNGVDTVLAVDQLSLDLAAGRVSGSQAFVIELQAVYPSQIKVIDIPVSVTEYQPDPVFTLTAPTTWDGRQSITVTPNISNLAAMQAKGVGSLNYAWSVAGLAVTKQASGGTLTLTRAQGSGPLTVTLTIDNGGTPVTATTILSVQEPANDAWVQRTPSANETPVNGQFFARDDTGYGNVYYNGVQAGATAAYLKIYRTENGSDVPYTTLRQTSLVGGAYAFTAPIGAGLRTYKLVFGTTSGGTDTDIATVSDLMCGDAYIIDGQSNAVADNNGGNYGTFTSEWIRSFGNMGGGNGSGWCNAVAASSSGDAGRIGNWGMAMAAKLVADYAVPICLINGAVGGTLISQHQANPADHTVAGTSYGIYANILNRVVSAKLTHGIRGVLWHQGENNSGAAAPTGDWDYKSYQQYFMDMAAAWKQDYPNIKHYYIFQVWPLPCAMGPKGDQLREVQRTLPRLFSNLICMSTVGTSGSRGLCHFDAAGYEQIAATIAPLLERDSNGLVPATAITAPNLKRAYFTSAAKTAIALEFDQDMNWNSASTVNFYLDKLASKVTSGAASGHIITLQLNAASTQQSIDYLEDAYWDGTSGNLLRGTNGIAALTFADVAIGDTPSTDPFTVWITSGNFSFPAGADVSLTGDPDHDGMSNFAEFAFGLDPASGASSNPIRGPFDKTTGTFTYTRNSTGLTYSVWTSSDMQIWTEDKGATQTAGTQVGLITPIAVRLSTIPSSDRFFVRVQAQ
ncbi:MAG: DUF2341 domain-containing protein, partial [Verrucomicrobiota bacterium]